MVATTLTRGKIAVIGVNTEDIGNPQKDSITFILMAPIGSGTQIFFTDRSWNGTTFAAAGGGDGTFIYTAGTDLPAGTVITITQAQLTAAGIDLSDLGETIYVYQGTVNAPTTFLHAVDIADGVTGFEGSELANTGLVNGQSAVAINVDNAQFGTRTNNINAEELFVQVNNNADWVQNDNSPQGDIVGPFTTAPDRQIWVAGSGAGEAIVLVNLDQTVSSGDVGYRLIQAFQNDPNLFHPSDITLDTVADKFFFVDADLAGNNRIIQGSISQVLGNPGAPIAFTVLYSNTGTGATGSMRTLSVDIVNDIIYFDVGTTLNKISYNTANQTPTVLLNLGANNFITQLSINYATGQVIMGSSRVSSGFGSDFISKNYIYTASGLTPTSTTLTATQLPFAQDDTVVGGEGGPLPGEAWPVEWGSIEGIDIDTVNNVLFISTGTVILDNDGNGPITYYGGVYRYALSGNPTGVVSTLYQQNGATGPVGQLSYIEVDPHSGQYYLIDKTGTNADPGDGGIWTGSLGSPGTPTLLATVGNINGLGPHGLEIQTAPTLTGTGNASLAVTEASSAPNSGETARVTLYSGLVASDLDTLDGTDELTGALVRISGGFTFEAASTATGHTATVDFLRIGGLTSGTITGSGIVFSYNQVTGQMTLTGPATVGEYAAALALVQFSTSGDNVTNDGSATTRTISASVFDGLLYSDEINATVTVTGINDAPLNTNVATLGGNEDSTFAFTGLTVSDADANSATQNLTVTLSAPRGTFDVNTVLAGGLTAGQVTGDNTGTVTMTGTANQINTVLNANGVLFNGGANANGNIVVTIATNDLGANGNDPGNSGSGTSEQDVDIKTITIAAINDAPTVSGDGTQDAPAILEDQPVGQTIAILFGPQYSDALDDQSAFVNGSSAQPIGGIAIIANGSNANGVWQYFNGTTWVDIGAASLSAAKLIGAATQIRFAPALNYNGAAPTLTAHLLDSSGAAVVDGSTVNLSVVNATGGTTRYSTGTVVLSQAVTPVNDAPVIANFTGDFQNYFEGDAPKLLDIVPTAALVTDVDSANFDGGSLNLAITAGGDAAEDVLGVLAGGLITTQAVAVGNTVSYNGTVIGTYTSDGKNGAPLTILFDADATPVAVAALISRLTYFNTDTDNPTAGGRAIDLTLDDGDGNANGGDPTGTATTIVTVMPINDAPEGSNNALTDLLEDTPYTFTSFNFSRQYSDPENDAFAGVRISTLPAAGTIFYDADGAGGGAPVAVTAGQVVSLADLDAGKLTFLAAANASGNPYTDFTFAVQDSNGAFDATPANMSLTVNAVNDAPVVSAAASYTATEQVALNLKGSISILDVDAGAGTVTATLSVPYGVLNVGAGTSGATVVSGNGTGSVVVSGTLAQINALLNSDGTSTVTFTANTDTPPASTTLTVSVNDGGNTGSGGAQVGVANSTINITAVDDPAVAVNDASSTPENATVVVTVLANDSDVDGPALSVATIAGQAATVGTPITLASGATATLNADGTITYNPNGRFNTLTAPGSGASNTSAIDSFTYALAGGGTATVNVTVNGVAGPGDRLQGTAGNDTITGTPQSDLFMLQNGGEDTATGLGSNDGFYMGAALSAGDRLDGGDGELDQVGLQGNYGASGTPFVFDAANFTSIELLALLPGNDTRFGDTANNFYDYHLKTVDGNVAAGQRLVVSFNTLRVGEDVTFDGSAETNGYFLTYAGSGTDTLTGGQQDDGFYFGAGRWGASDVVNGQGGALDQLGFQGDYTITFGASQIVGIEMIVLLTGFDTRFGDGGANRYDYNLTMNDGNVAAGQTMTVTGNVLASDESLNFNGSAETNGRFVLYGGAGNDVLTGGAGADILLGGGRGDTLTGGLGNDIFRYDNVTDSNPTERDGIQDFNLGDLLDLSRIDANSLVDGDQAFSFVGSAAFSNTAGELRFENISLGGPIWLVQGDVNGDGVSDFEVVLVINPPDPIISSDFIL